MGGGRGDEEAKEEKHGRSSWGRGTREKKEERYAGTEKRRRR